MSSTSSTERNPKTPSATEILASRYRHLFALPSYQALLVYGGIASLALTVLSRWTSGLITFISVFAVFALSAATISSALLLTDRKTIATFRRVQALLLAGDLLWFLVAGIGAALALSASASYPLTNAILFGAFVCTGLEFLIIQGAFEKNPLVSLGLAVIHPTSTLLILRLPELEAHFDAVAALSGVIVLAVMAAFPLLLRQRKTSLGYDALSLFQAFMKTWAEGNTDDLEKVIANHSEEVEVTTKVLRFTTKAGSAYLVLPGVHPGPFHPVGSYDLPGVVSRSFDRLGPVMTLHRPGGHERNLATRAETAKYAASVSELARRISPREEGVLRGPEHAKVGKATVSSSAFGDDLLTTISFAPLGSDDIDTKVESELAGLASGFGFDLSIVDAHNSIDPNLVSPMSGDAGWYRLFEATKNARPEEFETGYAHSNEVGFVGQGDITENGVALLLIRKGDVKSVLVLADANNSVPALRAAVEDALGASGYGLIEFCTSDSHSLAARGLTVERGYEALGEATSLQSVADLVVKLAKLAEAKLAPTQYGSAKMASRVRVFGSRALDEFATITQASSRFSRRYFRAAVAVVAALLFVSLFF